MIAISRRLILGIHLVLLFLLLQCPSPVLATTITGKVIKVAYGDTITILTPQKKQVKIRLYGIDTPENGQTYSKKAKQLTSSLVAGKDVHVEVYDTDRYGRTAPLFTQPFKDLIVCHATS